MSRLIQNHIKSAAVSLALFVMVVPYLVPQYAFLLQPEEAQAATGVPEIISYQGRLTDAAGELLGGAGTNYYFKFSIYDSPTVPGGNKLWPAGAPGTTTLGVEEGVFNVNIGDTANGYPDALDYDFQSNDTAYLQVEVSANIGGPFETLSPRQQITSAGFAINAGAVQGLTPGTGANNILALDGAGDISINGNIVTGANLQGLAVLTNTITPSGALTVGATSQTALLQGSVTTVTSSGAGNDIILDSADTIELQDNTNISGALDITGVINAGSSNVNITLATGMLDADALGLITGDGAGATSSGSGLETDGDRLGLLQGCANGEILKWDDAGSEWACAADASGGGAGTLQDSYDNGGTITTASAKDIDLVLADSATDSSLDIDILADNTVTISRNDGASVEAPSQLLLLENLDTDLTIAAGILMNVATGGAVTTGVDLSDDQIVTALAVGNNDVTVGGATISSSEFAVLDGGIDLTSEVAGLLPTADGGTGVDTSSAANGTLLIGNGAGLTLATLTDGAGITVTEGSGSITIAATLGTSVDLTSEVTGILPVANGGTGASSLNNLITLGTHTTGNYIATVADSGSGMIDVTGSGSESAAVTLGIVSNSLTATQLSATLTFADGDLIDLSGINASGTAEGLLLPQNTVCSSGTAEGQVCWDTDNDVLSVGTGAGTVSLLGAGSSLFTAAGSSGSSSTISAGDTLTIAAGAGVTTTGNGAGTITVASTLGTSVDLTSEVTGILPVANGGTGASSLNNLITLGTHTTGNYVATIADSGAGTISVSNSGAESAAVTLGIVADSIGDTQLAFNTGQHLTTTSTPTFASLTLNGALTLANSETIANSTDSTFIFGRNDAGAVTVTAADDDSTAALTVLPGGAAALTLGGSSTTSVTVTTDGTGDGEVVLPGGSVGNSELVNSSITINTASPLGGGGAVSLGGSLNLTCATCLVSGGSLFTAAGSSGSSQTIAAGDTLTIVAGAGITTTAGATDTVTIASTLGTSVDLTSEVTGILPVANGGTGASSLNNLITLGTHTTGNYVATVADSGTGTISVTGSGSESAAVTLGIVADSIGDTQLAFNTGQNLTTASAPSFDGLSLTDGLVVSNVVLDITTGADEDLTIEANGTGTVILDDSVTVSDGLTVTSLAGGGNQCLQVNNSGVISGTGDSCGTSTGISSLSLAGSSGSTQTLNDGDTITIAAGAGITTTGGVTDTITVASTLGTSVDLTSEVTGILPVANGGTGASSLNNLITLGTHTTGDYVATIADSGAGTISVSNSGAESAAVTLGIVADSIGDAQLAFDTGQHLTTASAVTFLTIDTGQGANELYDMDQNVTTASNVQFSTLTLDNDGLHLLDTNGSHDLIVAPGSDLTADRTLTVSTGDADRTLTLAGDATVSGTNTGDVTLAGAPDYITISGQVITRGLVDLATDITGVLPVGNGGTGASSLNNLITLGTHTTGNYVATIADSGSGTISVSNSGSESAAVTLGIVADSIGDTQLAFNTGQHLTTASGVTFDSVTAANDVGAGSFTLNAETITDFSGTGVTVSGNALTVALGTDIVTGEIVDGTILPADLNDGADTPGDEECLTYESTGSAFEWQSCVSGSITSLTLAGSSGSSQTISDGDTITIAAGSGITTTAGATDTVTIASTLGTSVDLTSEVTGILPVANGGTGASSLNNLITLGTHTAGDYVATVADSGTGTISVTGSGSESAAVTLGIVADSIGDAELAFDTGQHLTSTSDVQFGSVTLDNDGLHLLDTNGSHDLIVAPGSDLTADRTLTITTGDADRTLTLAGDATVSGTSSGTNTGDVTLAGALDYITISGQVITRGAIDLTTDVTGVLPVANGGTGASSLNNLITLGTHTAGNYVATIADSGSGTISVSNSGAESAAVTLGIVADSIGDTQLAFNTGQHLTTASSPSFAGATLTGGMAVSGVATDITTGTDEDLTIVANGTGTINLNDTVTIGSTITATSLAGGGTQCLQVDNSGVISGTGDACGTSTGISTLTLAGDSGSSQTLNDGNTVTIAGGTGVATSAGATDTVTVSFDCSEVEGADIDCSGESITLESTVDTVSTLNLAGTGTLNGLDAIDATTEATLEAALDLADLQGGVTDAQVPNNITIDLATLASTVTVVDSTDATSFVAIFDSATGSLTPKTDGTLLYDASNGTLTATTFSGSFSGTLTGNASTATALAANGTNCSAGSGALGVDASGNAESCTDFEEDLSNSAGLLAALSDETGSGLAVFNDSPTFADDLTVNAAGVRITGGSDGEITFLGIGDGAGDNDENFTINLEDTANTISLTSSTGVTLWDFGTINVSTDTLALTGTGTISGLDAIDATTEATLESALDIAGDVDGTGLGSVDLDELAVETELEGVLDLADLQGSVTDAQVPNNITVDLATLATTATALAANPTDCAANQFANAIAADGDLTCAAVDLAAAVTGILPVANGGTGASSLNNLITLGTHTTGDYVASVTAGGGLTGTAASEGSTPTLAVGAGAGIAVNADDVAVDTAADFAWTGQHDWTNTVTATGAVLDVNMTLGNDGDADSAVGINVSATSAATGDADQLAGINISDLTSADASVVEVGLAIGANWDSNLYFNDTTAHIAVADTGTVTFEDALGNDLLVIADTTGDGAIVLPAGSVSGTEIADATVAAGDLLTQGTATDEYCLTSETGGGALLAWQSCSAGSMTSFTLAGSSGSSQTISDGDTLTIAAGTGITTTAGATDTVTVAVDESAAFDWTAQHTLTDTLTDGAVQTINLTLDNDTGGDSVFGLLVSVTSAATGDADTLYGINIGNLSSANGTVLERALRIGSGWDEAIDANGTLISLAELQALDGGISLASEITGTLPVANGGTGTSTTFTQGSVVFAGASGVYSQDNANFFWDDTNNRLGLGDATPDARLDIDYSSTSTTPATEYASYITVTDTGAVSSGTDVTYGQRIDVTRTGAIGDFIRSYGQSINVVGDSGGATTAIGLHADASGADNNWAISTSGGDVHLVFGPGEELYTEHSGNAGDNRAIYNFLYGSGGNTAIYNYLEKDGSLPESTYGVYNETYNYSAVSSGTDATYGNYTYIDRSSATGGTIENYGHRIEITDDGGGSSTNYGLHVAVSGADNNYSGVFTGGNFGIGTTAPESLLEVQALEGTDAVISLDADDGDDNADTWFISSTAANNSLSFANHTTEVAALSSTGSLQLDSLVSGGSQCLQADSSGNISGTGSSCGGSFGGITLAGSSGSSQTISDGDTLTIAAGSGITTTAGATDTVTIASTLGTSVDLTSEVTGILPVANGGTGTSTAFTQGSVVFAGASGVYSQDNANLYWDDSTNRLGIGDATPDATLELYDATNTPVFSMSDDDIGHPATTVAQPDVFGALTSISSTVGGLRVAGFTDGDSVESVNILGIIGTSNPADTTPSVIVRGAKSDGGTGLAALGNNETVFQVWNYGTAQATFTGNGYLGLGDTSPDSMLDVAQSSALTASLVTFESSGGTVTDGVNALDILFTQGDDGDATDSNAGIFVSITSNSTDADDIAGIEIDSLAGGQTAATSQALVIQDTWDAQIFLNDTSSVIQVADGGTITFEDESGNDLMAIVDTAGDGSIVLPNNSIGVAEVNDGADTPGDEECLTYESTGAVFEWQTCGGGGGGGMSIGGAVTSGTAGSVLFVDGSGDLAQDNTNFFWDDTNNRLSLGGDTTPESVLDITYASTSATADNNDSASTITVSDTGAVSTGTDEIYGQVIDLTRTGSTGGTINAFGQYVTLTGDSGGSATTSNYAIYADATGADNNYALYTGAGGVLFDFTATASEDFLVFSDNVTGTKDLIESVISGTGTLSGFEATVTRTGSTAGVSVGAELYVTSTAAMSSGSDFNYGSYIDLTRTSATGGTITNYGQRVIVSDDGGGSSTNYGLHVAVSGADNNYSGVFTGGNFGIGDTTPDALLNVAGSITTSGASAVAGTLSELTLTNSTGSGFQFGNRTLVTVNGGTAGTEVGEFIRVTDDTSLVNTIRGLEVQSYSGTNNNGVNTGIAAFAKTFGVHAETTAQAGSVAQAAAVFADLNNSADGSLGNAIRAYSNDLTSANLVHFTQDTSTFTGSGLLMNFAAGSGTFSGEFVTLQNNGTEYFHVDSDGSTFVSFTGSATTNGVCHTSSGNTNNDELVDCSSTPGDIAEWYETEANVTAGDVVMVTGTRFNYDEMMYNPFTGMQTGVERNYSVSVLGKAQADAGRVLGVVSTSPYQTYGEAVLESGAANAQPVALNGRVPVKVTEENGQILAGDSIGVSEVLPGHGAKMAKSGQQIGIALEDSSGNGGADTIMVFVNLAYQVIDVDLSSDGEAIVAQADIDMNEFSITNVKAISSATGNWSIDEAGVLVVEKVQTKELCLDDLCITRDQLQQLLNGSGVTGSVQAPPDDSGDDAEPTPTPTPSPTASPSPTPTPSSTPSPTPSPTPTPTPEEAPEPIPEPTPEPTPEPEPEPEPDPEPEPEPTTEPQPEE